MIFCYGNEEDACAYFTDKVLKGILPKNVLNSKVLVYLLPDEEGCTAICYKGNKWSVRITARMVSGSRVMITAIGRSKTSERIKYYEITNHGDYGNKQNPHIKVSKVVFLG